MLVKGFILMEKTSFPGKLTHAKERLGRLEDFGTPGLIQICTSNPFPRDMLVNS